MDILLNIVHNCEMYQHNVDQAMNIAADEHELELDEVHWGNLQVH